MTADTQDPVTRCDHAPPGDGPAWGWEVAYAGQTPPLWDIGRPQPAFVRLAELGLLRGRVLDVGCGTGEHTLLAACCGAEATGVDISPRAVELARRKADARRIPASFAVADALDLARLGGTFDTILDSGTFHVFDNRHRGRYVASLASVLDRGVCYLLCLSDRQPEPLDRPRRVSRSDLTAAFGTGWTISSITADVIELNPGGVTGTAQAWFATVRRNPGEQGVGRTPPGHDTARGR